MKRLIYAGAIALAATTFHSQLAQAFGDAPWCAVVSIGNGDVIWQCQYRSIEECQPNVIAGNRGFCNMNPAWPGWSAPTASEPVRHRKRHKQVR
jgi:hypothetical protein